MQLFIFSLDYPRELSIKSNTLESKKTFDCRLPNIRAFFLKTFMQQRQMKSRLSKVSDSIFLPTFLLSAPIQP